MRPLSLDSAMIKGSIVPGGPLMKAIDGNTEYRFTVSSLPIELVDYSAIFFPFDTNVAATVEQISDVYHIPLERWRCRPIVKISGQAIGVCEP
jgi:hypothetical protein